MIFKNFFFSAITLYSNSFKMLDYVLLSVHSLRINKFFVFIDYSMCHYSIVKVQTSATLAALKFLNFTAIYQSLKFRVLIRANS